MAPIVSMLPLVVPVFCTFCTFRFRLGLGFGLGLVHRHGGIHEPLEKGTHYRVTQFPWDSSQE